MGDLGPRSVYETISFLFDTHTTSSHKHYMTHQQCFLIALRKMGYIQVFAIKKYNLVTLIFYLCRYFVNNGYRNVHQFNNKLQYQVSKIVLSKKSTVYLFSCELSHFFRHPESNDVALEARVPKFVFICIIFSSS